MSSMRARLRPIRAARRRTRPLRLERLEDRWLLATFNSADIPRDIPEGGGTSGTTNSVLSVPSSLTIDDVDVTISLTHTVDSDLDIFLRSPQGTLVELSTDNGGSADNYIDTRFDDEAAFSITAGSPPFTGSFQPETPLSALDGEDAQGEWTLEIVDDTAGEVGVLGSWSLEIAEATAEPCTLDVTLTVDGLQNGTLRHAIRCANSIPGANTIDVPAGTYTLSLAGDDEDAAASGDLDITDELTIFGDGAAATVIDASGLDVDGTGPGFGDRAFHVLGVPFAMVGTTITGGNLETGDGGGLFNEFGATTLSDTVVQNNATVGSGGGLATVGTGTPGTTSLTLNNVTVANNRSTGSGGGIFSGDDTLDISRSSIQDNQSQSSGGGILVTSFASTGSTLNMTLSTVAGNQAGGDGGGIAGFSETLNISDSTFSNNRADGSGGGIESLASDLNLIRSTLNDNEALLAGGGIFTDGGTADIAETTLSGNEAGSGGGGIGSARGTVQIVNSTLSGNSTAEDGAGGGIQNGDAASLSLLNSTIAFNQAGHGGGLEIASGATSTELDNTIVAGNTNIEVALPGDIFGSVDAASSSNLIGDGSNLSGISNGLNGNQIGTGAVPIDPLLGPLHFNGGSTFTHLPVTGSPAIDAGNNSVAPPIDQRGGPRPQPTGGVVDIGAVELQTGCSTEVTTAADTADPADGVTSLREAIVCANLTPGADTITFAIEAPGVQTIDVGSTGLGPLPQITEAVTIDGYSQPDAVLNTDPLAFDGTLLIELNGATAGEIANGLEIIGGGSTVRGLIINRFRGDDIGDTFFGGNAIFLGEGRGNAIEGNLLGTDADGDTDLGNENAAILIGGASDSSPDNTIGGTTPAARNVISGNRLGVEIENAGSTGNLVAGNLIGTNAQGTAGLDITTAAIGILDASNNTIGGTTPEARNVISGNAIGIFIVSSDSPATGNMVLGNYIGTDVTGGNDVGNDVGVVINAGGNTIGGTSAAARNVISGNNATGLVIAQFTAAAGTGNRVEGNVIGVDATGDVPLPNGGGDLTEIATRFNQVVLDLTGDSPDVTAELLAEIAGGVGLTGASGHTIGGTAAGAGNLISDNLGSGVSLAGSNDNEVVGNFIGTDLAGDTDRGNTMHGVSLLASSNNTIGGAAAGAANVISGNGRDGVHISGPTAENNLLHGNLIGTNGGGAAPVGTAPLGNSRHGVFIESPNNSVGGASAGEGNIIGGNGSDGVSLFGADATGNTVAGNSIGIDALDSGALSNGDGVVISGAADNTIGGATAAAGNVISGNLGAGVLIQSVGATGNVVQHNRIGTDSGGTENVANSGAGVFIAGASSNTVADNTIAFNAFGTFDTGVVITAGTNNALRRNSMFQNEGLGIDLADDGVTQNDPDDPDTGPNDRLNFPVLESATVDGANLSVSGFARPQSEIELFVADPDPTGFGEGKTFLALRIEGSADDGDTTTGSYGPAAINGLDQGSDTTNRFTFVIPLASLPGTVLTATATDAGGNTSEFSGNVTVEEAAGPSITATKSDAFLLDADGDGRADPGDTLRYTVAVSNSGASDALSVILTDTPDGDTSLVVGSVTTTQGSVTGGNGAGETSVTVQLETLAPGTTATVVFDVTVDGTLPAGVGQVANQASVTGENFATLASDDPDTPTPADATRTPAEGAAQEAALVATNSDALLADADGDGLADPGDTVRYTIDVANQGDATALGVSLTDEPDANTMLVVGSVTTTLGTVTRGNDPGDTSIVVDLGDLPAANMATVVFDVTVNAPLPPSATQLANQADVDGENVTPIVSDDPATPAPNDPTLTGVDQPQVVNNSIAGFVYVDTNNNGRRDPPELGLPNVPVTITGTIPLTGMDSSTGTLEGDGSYTTMTGDDGSYRFDNLPDDTYAIRETQPGAFLDGVDSLGQPALGRVENDRFVDVALSGGAAPVEYNFAERGLLPELITKRLFLNDTPDIGTLLTSLELAAGANLVAFTATQDGVLAAAAPGGVVELYDGQMRPVALARSSEPVEAAVAAGERYVLFVEAPAGGVRVEVTPVAAPPAEAPTVAPSTVRRFDVSGDRSLSAIDAVLVLNELAARRVSERQSGRLRASASAAGSAIDVNGDGFVSPLDALQVINALNRRAAELLVAEPPPATPVEPGPAVAAARWVETSAEREDRGEALAEEELPTGPLSVAEHGARLRPAAVDAVYAVLGEWGARAEAGDDPLPLRLGDDLATETARG